MESFVSQSEGLISFVDHNDQKSCWYRLKSPHPVRFGSSTAGPELRWGLACEKKSSTQGQIEGIFSLSGSASSE